MKKFKKLFIVMGGFILISIIFCQTNMAKEKQQISIPISSAENYFSEIKELCEKDGGNLWGKSLYTAFLFVDPQTRDVVANEPDNQGILEKSGNVYIGKFPEDKIIANSTTTLGNKKYAMVMWQDFSSDKLFRNSLFIHEIFHYQQPLLGLQSTKEYANNHLDEMNARIYLKLEWMALDRAINNQDKEKIEAIEDALIFRQLRRDTYSAAKSENNLEIAEGIPEYTGITMASSSKSEIKKLLKNALEEQINSDSFVRSFAYYSGPAYGVLLDEVNDNWRKKLKPNSDLGNLLKENYKIEIQSNTFDTRKEKYNYQEIYEFEQKKKQKKDKLIKKYEEKFTNNAIVKIKVNSPSIGFNPKNLIPLKDLGTVYPNIVITDSFGTLTVKRGGCLFNWKTAIVSAKNISIKKEKISGDGWTIKLNKGYSILKQGKNYRIK